MTQFARTRRTKKTAPAIVPGLLRSDRDHFPLAVSGGQNPFPARNWRNTNSSAAV
jgi:hypothetical protein